MELFVVFGFAVEILLLAFFAAHRWWRRAELPIGRLVYGMGLPAVLLMAAYPLAGEAWHLALAFGLYAAWSGLGATIDLVHPIAWRQPPRWSILIPYATLLMAALIAFWVPLWWMDRGLWIVFGLLYAAHTTLNVSAHRRGGSEARTAHR